MSKILKRPICHVYWLEFCYSQCCVRYDEISKHSYAHPWSVVRLLFNYNPICFMVFEKNTIIDFNTFVLLARRRWYHLLIFILSFLIILFNARLRYLVGRGTICFKLIKPIKCWHFGELSYVTIVNHFVWCRDFITGIALLNVESSLNFYFYCCLIKSCFSN